jgi:hypothetical protein
MATASLVKDGQDLYGLVARAVPELTSGGRRLRACRVTSTLQHRGKHLVHCALETHDTESGHDHLDQVVVKFAEGDRSAGFDALVTLWRAGFRPPSPFQVPRPYGHSVVDNAIVVGFAQGHLWADLIGGSPSHVSRASEQAADLLVQLQRQPPGHAAAAPRPASGQVGRSDRSPGELADDLSRAFPACADRVQTLAARLDDALARGKGDLVAAHGDYHPKNVIVTDTTATMIDLDTYGAREPAFDVGYAIGQLLVMSQLRLGRLGPGFAAAERFWAGYSRAGSAGWDRVSVQAARTFMQSMHFELCVLRNDRFELLEWWSDLMETLLAGAAGDGRTWLANGAHP